jgi:hypothetical protein
VARDHCHCGATEAHLLRDGWMTLLESFSARLVRSELDVVILRTKGPRSQDGVVDDQREFSAFFIGTTFMQGRLSRLILLQLCLQALFVSGDAGAVAQGVQDRHRRDSPK